MLAYYNEITEKSLTIPLHQARNQEGRSPLKKFSPPG